jgi:uncharacterized protein
VTSPRAEPADRLVQVDLLRGAALLGILAVNVWFFASSSLRVGEPDPAFAAGAGRLAYGLVVLLFATKSYLMFAFLFGYSFVLQEEAAERAAAAFGPRMRRRLLGLIMLGLIQGIVLFPGDILLTYGVLGFVLLAMHGADPAALVRLGVAVTIAAAALLGFLGLVAWAAAGPAPDSVGADAAQASSALRGAPRAVVAANASQYASALASILFVQALPALGAMLVGMAAGRVRYFGDAQRPRRDWHRIRILAPLIGMSGAAAFTWATLSDDPAVLLAGFAITTVTAPFLTATYVAALLAWCRTSPNLAVLRSVAAAGRLALTNYLAQSVVLSLLFTGYGLALMDQVTAVQTVAIVAGIFAVQALISAWWVRRYRYGPAEWVLRRWTYRGSRA